MNKIIAGCVVMTCVLLAPSVIAYFFAKRFRTENRNLEDSLPQIYRPSVVTFLEPCFLLILGGMFVFFAFRSPEGSPLVGYFFGLIAIILGGMGLNNLYTIVGLSVRVDRLGIVIKRWESELVIPPSKIEYIRISGITVLIGHSGGQKEEVPVLLKNGVNMCSQFYRIIDQKDGPAVQP